MILENVTLSSTLTVAPESTNKINLKIPNFYGYTGHFPLDSKFEEVFIIRYTSPGTGYGALDTYRILPRPVLTWSPIPRGCLSLVLYVEYFADYL